MEYKDGKPSLGPGTGERTARYELNSSTFKGHNESGGEMWARSPWGLSPNGLSRRTFAGPPLGVEAEVSTPMMDG